METILNILSLVCVVIIVVMAYSAYHGLIELIINISNNLTRAQIKQNIMLSEMNELLQAICKDEQIKED